MDDKGKKKESEDQMYFVAKSKKWKISLIKLLLFTPASTSSNVFVLHQLQHTSPAHLPRY